MGVILFSTLKEKDKSQAVDRLIEGSTPSQDFFFLITLSILTATFGLLIDNFAVVIGSMLIAPMLYPLLSTALGITISDYKLISRSLFTLLKSLAFGIIASASAAFVFAPSQASLSHDIIVVSQPSLIYAAIAVVAGLAASFALVKPQLSEILPGTAISVTLIPPIAAIGIGVAELNSELISNSLLLFLVNAIGIIFASTITFSLMNFYTKQGRAEEDIKREDKKLKEDKKRAEESQNKK